MPHEAGHNGNHSGLRLVIGGNRGIGLALVEAQLGRTGFSKVVATHRPNADLARLFKLKRQHGEKVIPLIRNTQGWEP
jgi:NAD(P)-dependent dehydrogenase (short-subunit alcohol dehydrogenase family)